MSVGSTENELKEGSVHICKYIHILDLVKIVWVWSYNYAMKADKFHSTALEPSAYWQGLVPRDLSTGDYMSNICSSPWLRMKLVALVFHQASWRPQGLPVVICREENTGDWGNIFLHINIYVKLALLRRWWNKAWKQWDRVAFLQILMREDKAKREK